MIIATHSGRFHADEVFALATLTLTGEVERIMRTRDEDILASCDLRVDVGRKFNSVTGDFDHHQPGGAGTRDNGIAYAAFGLIWKQYGEQVCGSAEVADRIDHKLVQLIDANDNGMSLFSSDIAGIHPYGIDRMVTLYNPSWKTETTPEDMDTLFNVAVQKAVEILRLEISQITDKFEAELVVKEAVELADGAPLIVMEQFAPWKEVVVNEASEALFIMFPAWPARNGEWVVQAIPVSSHSFENRQDLPVRWGGKEGAELVKETGILDAGFCHASLFLITAKSRAAALELANLAIAAG